MEKAGVLSLQVEPIRDHPDAIKVVLDGSIDPKTVTRFRDDMMALHAKGAKRFLVDCSRLTYINSSGLASILNLAGTVKPKGGAVALAALDSKILVIFKMMGIIELFQFFPSYKDALRHLDEKLAAELRDVGPALQLEEPPPPVATPRPAMRAAPRVETSKRPMRAIPPPPPVNPIVQFFRSLFGLDEVSPVFFRRSGRKRR
jgi:anti-sigma B factor antagonist